MNAFWSEVLGTATLILLGAGVVANVILPRTKGFNGGWLLINFGWGLAVFSGVYVAYKSGAHLNPAVTMGIWTSGADEFAPGPRVWPLQLSADFVNWFEPPPVRLVEIEAEAAPPAFAIVKV